MKRLNITLPDDIAQQLEDKHNKSRFIARAVKEKIEREKRAQLERQLVEGYKATDKEDATLDSEWEKAGLEVWE